MHSDQNQKLGMWRLPKGKRTMLKSVVRDNYAIITIATNSVCYPHPDLIQPAECRSCRRLVTITLTHSKMEKIQVKALYLLKPSQHAAARQQSPWHRDNVSQLTLQGNALVSAGCHLFLYFLSAANTQRLFQCRQHIIKGSAEAQVHRSCC